MWGRLLLSSLVLAHSTLGLQVLSPSNVSGFVRSPLFNYGMGDQSVLTNITAEVVYSETDVCSRHPAELAGKIVLIDSDDRHFWELATEMRLVKCVEDAGGLAVILAYAQIGEPGFGYRFNRNVRNRVTIPVVNIVRGHMAAAISELVLFNSNVTVELTIDENRWMALWDTDEFFWTFRVVLPSLNIIGVLIALRAIQLHYENHKNPTVPAHARKPDDIVNQRIMLFACFIELSACMIRAVYCGIGPIFSTTVILYPVHAFIVNITVPFQVIASLIASALFIRWGAFGENNAQRRLIEKGLILTCMGAIPLQIIVVYLTMYNKPDDVQVLLLAQATMLFAMLFGTSLFFLVYGTRFIKQLKGKGGSLSKLPPIRRRQLFKAVYWIMVSGITQFLTIAGTAAAADESVLFKPRGFYYCLVFIYFGITGQALAQGMALKPFTPVAITAQMGQGLRVLKGKISQAAMKLRKSSENVWQSASSTALRVRRASAPDIGGMGALEEGNETPIEVSARPQGKAASMDLSGSAALLETQKTATTPQPPRERKGSTGLVSRWLMNRQNSIQRKRDSKSDIRLRRERQSHGSGALEATLSFTGYAEAENVVC